MEVSLGRALAIQPGAKVKLLTPSGMKRCEVVGLLAARSVGAGQGGFLFAALPEVQDWFGQQGLINRIQLQLALDANLEEVRARLTELLPPGLSVRVPPARSRLAEGTLRPTIQALSFCSALAFVMAAFIILNSFLMSVSERRQLLSTMRALGTTRRQILALLLSEGLLLGTLGTVLGCALGLGAARLLRNVLEQLVWGTLPPLVVTSEPFILAGLLGPGVALLGAYLPARRASLVSPLEGIRGLLPEEKPTAVRGYIAGGLLLGLLAAFLIVGCIWEWLPIGLAPSGGVLAMIAAVLLLPPVLPTLERLVAGLMTPWLRFEARLAHLTVLRYRVRSALTVGVLFVALCTGFAMGNTLINNVQDVQRWSQRTFECDYLLRPYRLETGSETTSDIPPSLEQRVRQVPHVTRVVSFRLVQVQAAGLQANLIVRQFPDPTALQMDLKKGKPAEVYNGLKDGVVLSTMLAQRTKLSIGDTIVVETTAVQRQLPIVGICSDYTLGGLSLFMERAAAKRLLGIDGCNGLLIWVSPTAPPQTREQLQALAEEGGLLLQPFTDFTRMIDEMMNGSTALIWGILVLGFLVAALALANTLSMNVLEQTREIGLMRAGGMTRAQVRRMVLFQALLLALVGLPLGALGGSGLAWLISLCLLPLIGHAVPFDFRFSLLAGCFGVALVIVLLAAWLPALRAARTPAIEAIHTE